MSTENEKMIIKTESTPDTGATKVTQLLLRRKTESQWGAYDKSIPIGEPCVSYNTTTGDYELRIGVPDIDGNP